MHRPARPVPGVGLGHRHRLGLVLAHAVYQPQLEPGSRCTPACRTHGPNQAIDEVAWRTGVHLLTCGCSPWRLKRHNKAGGDALKKLYQDLGFSWEEKNVSVHIDSGKRVDAICKNAAADYRPQAVDITVGCGACQTYVTPAAAREPGWLTDRLEREKTGKHGGACVRMGMTFAPAAFTTYGGWGKIVYGKLDEEYEQRKKEEKAEGKSGWAAYRWKRDLLERMSIAIAKGNWALLDAHTPVRPFGAAA